MLLLFTYHQGSRAQTKRIRGKQRADKSPKARPLDFGYTNNPKLGRLGLVSL